MHIDKKFPMVQSVREKMVKTGFYTVQPIIVHSWGMGKTAMAWILNHSFTSTTQICSPSPRLNCLCTDNICTTVVRKKKYIYMLSIYPNASYPCRWREVCTPQEGIPATHLAAPRTLALGTTTSHLRCSSHTFTHSFWCGRCSSYLVSKLHNKASLY